MVLLCGVAALPFLLSGLVAAWRGWTPTWDTAFIQLRVLDVGGGRTPLIGMPSTVSQNVGGEVHHPGPLHFWLLAGPFTLLRGMRGGLALAEASIGAAVAALTVAAARGSGSRAAWWVAAAWPCVALAVGDEVLHDPWNPSFALVALIAATSFAIVLVERAVPWVVGAFVVAASAAAQAHLVAAIPAAAMVATVGVMIARPAAPRATTRRRLFVIGAIAGLVAWSGPLVDQAVNRPGNLWALASGSGDTGTSFGPVTGFARFARMLVPPGLVADGVPMVASGVRSVVVWLVALTLLGLAAIGGLRRRASGRSSRAHAVVLVLVISTWIAQAVTPESYSSVFGRHIWALMWPAAMAVWVTAGAAVVDLAASGRLAPVVSRASVATGRRHRAALALLTVVAAVVTLASSLPDQRDGRWMPIARRFAESVPVGDLAGRSVLVAGDGIGAESELVAGLAADLARSGVDVRLGGPIAAGLVHLDRLIGDEGAPALIIGPADRPLPDGAEVVLELTPPFDTYGSPLRLVLVPARP